MQTKVIYLIPTNAMLFYNARHFSKMLHLVLSEVGKYLKPVQYHWK